MSLSQVSDSEKILAKVTVPAETTSLEGVLDFVDFFSGLHNFPDEVTKKLRLIVEEACINVIEHAYDPGDRGTYDLYILRRPGQFVIAVEDQGLPADFRDLQEKNKAGLGITFMKAFSDEIHFINLGRLGKRVELVKNLPQKRITEYFDNEALRPIEDTTVTDPGKTRIRFMTGEDVVQVSRCIYRSYKYSYTFDFLYYPEKMLEALEGGYVKSCIAENQDNEVIGHLALVYETPGANVADSGRAVVDPRYRGLNIFKMMKDFMVNYARESGLYGIFAECVTIHPYTQKGNIKIGAKEMGVILGFSPETTFFKGIQTEETHQRLAVVMYYLRLNDEPQRDVYLPDKHKGILKEIYERSGLRRTFEEPLKPKDIPDSSQLMISAIEEANRVNIRVRSFGKDFKEAILYRLRESCYNKYACIFVDMPLSDPGTAYFYQDLETAGFFFSCIIPEMENGDVIRFSYLNNVPVDPSKIIIESDFGKKLLEYTYDEYKRTNI